MVVRAPETGAEEDEFYRATARVFDGGDGGDGGAGGEDALREAAGRWRQRLTGGGRRVHRRAAFSGGALLGSCVVYERLLRLGPGGVAQLRTACIGAVLSLPEHRRQGVGSALMRDAVRFGADGGFALLLLSGVPDYYHRFGFVDVMERAGHVVDRADLDALDPPGRAGDEMRVETAADGAARALLALYERHYGARPGGFQRTLDDQERRLRAADAGARYLIASDARGRPRGYVKLGSGEAAADTWPAAWALLRHQFDHPPAGGGALSGQGGQGAPASVTWQAPPGSATHYVLADNVRLRTEHRSQPRAGWLARPAHVPTLVRSFLPAFRARWRDTGMAWRGTIELRVGGDAATGQRSHT